MGRTWNTTSSGGSFDEKTIEAVWDKVTPESGYTSFRKDKCGASMKRDRYGKTEQWGWEIDHIKPISKGGTDDLDNLRPLHWENNREKSDSYPDSQWKCKIIN